MNADRLKTIVEAIKADVERTHLYFSGYEFCDSGEGKKAVDAVKEEIKSLLQLLGIEAYIQISKLGWKRAVTEEYTHSGPWNARDWTLLGVPELNFEYISVHNGYNALPKAIWTNKVTIRRNRSKLHDNTRVRTDPKMLEPFPTQLIACVRDIIDSVDKELARGE